MPIFGRSEACIVLLSLPWWAGAACLSLEIVGLDDVLGGRVVDLELGRSVLDGHFAFLNEVDQFLLFLGLDRHVATLLLELRGGSCTLPAGSEGQSILLA